MLYDVLMGGVFLFSQKLYYCNDQKKCLVNLISIYIDILVGKTFWLGIYLQYDLI